MKLRNPRYHAADESGAVKASSAFNFESRLRRNYEL